jgi:phosphatidate cytidylyltransferase
VRFGIVIGLAAGLLGPLGDLFKSALKREIRIKDFGSIIPGHGGVVDRFDSLLFTAPVVGWLASWMGR